MALQRPPSRKICILFLKTFMTHITGVSDLGITVYRPQHRHVLIFQILLSFQMSFPVATSMNQFCQEQGQRYRQEKDNLNGF